MQDKEDQDIREIIIRKPSSYYGSSLVFPCCSLFFSILVAVLFEFLTVTFSDISAARALRLRPELPEHFIRVITAGHQSLGCPAGWPQRCGEEGL